MSECGMNEWLSGLLGGGGRGGGEGGGGAVEKEKEKGQDTGQKGWDAV